MTRNLEMNEIIRYNPPQGKITLADALKLLQSELPEFWVASIYKEDNLSYMLFEEFGDWVGRSIQVRTPESYKTVGKSFELVNKLLECGDDEVVNHVQVSFLEAANEHLDDSVEINKILHPDGVRYLERWRKFLRRGT